MPESEKFKLIALQDQESIDFTRWKSSLSWKGILNDKDYVLREKLLSLSEMAKKYMAFMLINNETNEKLCSCEIMFRDGIRFDKQTDSKQLVDRKVKSASIGAVFTYPEHRGNGYAKIMINLLIKNYLNLMKVNFVILYLEIGEFYSQFGFKSFHVPLLQKKLNNLPLNSNSNIFEIGKLAYEITNNRSLKLIEYHQFKPLIDLYNYHTHKNFNKMDKNLVTIDINEHMIDWFHLRSKYIHHKTFDQNSPEINFNDIEETNKIFKTTKPQYFGFTINDQLGNILSYAIWTYDWTPKSNYITIINLFTIPNYESLKIEMIKYIEDYCSMVNSKLNNLEKFDTLKIWSSDISNDDFGGEEIVNSSLGAIKMINDEDSKDLENGELIWVNNNKMTWY